jgi:dihydropteroate synthase
MGVLNVTPDSFSDGGRHFDSDAAVAAGIRMASDGADLIDVGGESTRPGSRTVPVPEEISRVAPVIRALAAQIEVPLSIDTRKAGVAEAALEAGASIVNDVSAGAFDPGILSVVRDSGAGFALMHMRGTPATMQQLTDYHDVVAEVHAYLRSRVHAAVDAGVAWECVAVDPGLGFAKSLDQNYVLMRDVARLADLGRPVLVGPSRKSFIGKVLETEVDDRLEGTAGAVAWLAGRGAHIVRVHDVKEMVRVVKVVDAIRRGRAEAEGAAPA